MRKAILGGAKLGLVDLGSLGFETALRVKAVAWHDLSEVAMNTWL